MENVYLKRIVDNPDAQNSFFQKVFKRGQILAIVYFCIILVTKGRSEFDKYSKLSDCFGDHRNEIRIALENIGKFIHAVKSNSKASSNRYTEAEVVGGRLRSTKRRKRTGKTRKNRYNSFHGGEPPAKSKLKFDIRSFLIVTIISLFLSLLLDDNYLKLLTIYSKHHTSKHTTPSLKGESLRRNNKKGPNVSAFLDIHAHGLNILENRASYYTKYFHDKGVMKFRPYVSDQEIHFPLAGLKKQALSYGFYNYWIHSDRLDKYHFSENVDPAIEMLEEYLNSNMHTSLQRKFLSFLDYSLKYKPSVWELPSGDKKDQMLPFLNTTWYIILEGLLGKKTDINQLKEISAEDAGTNDQLLRIAVNHFCDKANTLGLDLDRLNYDGPHTSIDELRSQYCNEVPTEESKLIATQKMYYEDGINKRIPQGYGRQMFEKRYSVKMYNTKLDNLLDSGGWGITLMLTTNLSEAQLKDLSYATTLENTGSYMYSEDVTGSYNQIEDFEEPTVDWDIISESEGNDFHRRVMINPERIPNVIVEETEKYTQYDFNLSDLVDLLRTYDIENIYIHEHSCDGYSDPDFRPREDQKHINTIKQRGGNSHRKKSKRRRRMGASYGAQLE
jgi:hypothetical protein